MDDPPVSFEMHQPKTQNSKPGTAPEEATLNHAAQVIAGISADQRADTALRFYFEHHRYLQPGTRRAITRIVFSYFRWLSWLEPKASPQKRLEQATLLQERFNADP